MAEERFRTALIAIAPDADASKYMSLIRTSRYELRSILVKDE